MKCNRKIEESKSKVNILKFNGYERTKVFGRRNDKPH